MTRTPRVSLGFFVLVAGLVGLTAGCGPPTLDSSSFKKLQSSVNKLREPMEEQTRARFDESLSYLVGEAAVVGDGTEEDEGLEHQLGVLESELDQTLGARLVSLGLESRAAHEVDALVPGDGKTQTGFQRRVLVGDVVAPMPVARLEAQRVEGVVAAVA